MLIIDNIQMIENEGRLLLKAYYKQTFAVDKLSRIGL